MGRWFSSKIYKVMAKREVEEINAGSMADHLAFLLLIFFPYYHYHEFATGARGETYLRKSDVEFLAK